MRQLQTKEMKCIGLLDLVCIDNTRPMRQLTFVLPHEHWFNLNLLQYVFIASITNNSVLVSLLSCLNLMCFHLYIHFRYSIMVTKITPLLPILIVLLNLQNPLTAASIIGNFLSLEMLLQLHFQLFNYSGNLFAILMIVPKKFDLTL